MNKASEALFTLKPVCFRYKKEIDPVGISQLDLVAEEVEKVNPDLAVRDTEGQALHRSLRSGERDVTQRIPQRTPQSEGIGNNSTMSPRSNACRNSRCRRSPSLYVMQTSPTIL
jgi:hypothetical protein